MQKLSLTHRLLIKCANTNGQCDDSLKEILMNDSLIWPEVIQSARSHGMIPLLYHNLTKQGLTNFIPQEIAEKLKNEYYISAASTLTLHHELQKVLEAFHKGNIEVVVLKGAALAETLYSNVTLRPFTDIDLLVREENWKRMRTLLSRLNFAAQGRDFIVLPPKLTKFDVLGHLHFYNNQGINLELQFDLLQLGLSMRTKDKIWQCARRTAIAGIQTSVLSPEYQLLHLCVHLNKHGYRRLIWFVDIAKFVEKTAIDWEKLCTLAKIEGMLPSVYFTLYYLNSFFGKLVSTSVIESLKPNFLKRIVWQSIWPDDKVVCLNAPHDAGLVFQQEFPGGWIIPNLIITGRTREKMHYFVRKVFPAPEFISNKYLASGRRLNAFSYIYHYLMRIKNRFSKHRSLLVNKLDNHTGK